MSWSPRAGLPRWHPKGGRDEPGDRTVRVAIVQEPPAILDLAEGVRRASKHIESAAAEGARLVAFPETWLTGYPAWIFGLAGWDDAEARRWYAALVQQCPSSDASELDPVRQAAARAGVTVVMGLNERYGRDASTLFNSQLTIGPEGQTVGVHRKLTPTHTERIVWAPSPDASGMRVHTTEFGRLGGLICWEHWQPLIRQAMHDQGEQIHVAAWPDMTDAHRVASLSYAFEGRCFVVAAAQFLRAEDVPDEVRDAYRAGVGPDTPESGSLVPRRVGSRRPGRHMGRRPAHRCARHRSRRHRRRADDRLQARPRRGGALRATRHLHPHRRPSPPEHGRVDRRRRIHIIGAEYHR